jgi:hypothetical protein
MKIKIILCATLLFSIYARLLAQSPCINEVSTEHTNPTNNSLPYVLDINGNPIVDNRYLNGFNWNAIDPATGTPASFPTINMQYNQNMMNMHNTQFPDYYNYIKNGEKMTVENGWELLLLNLGRFPNQDIIPVPDFTDIPYMVFYNKYRGVVRVLANYGNGILSSSPNIDAMRIELTISDGSENLNGILRLNEEKDKALDQKTSVKKVSALAFHPNQPNKWFSADFQITYDPCICYYPSLLQIKFHAIENQTLDLVGREISLNQNLVSGKAINTQNFLTNFDYTTETAEGGMVMYKALEYLVNEYEAKLDKYQAELDLVNEYNKKIRRNKVVISAFKHLVLNGGSAAISEIIGMSWFQEMDTIAEDLLGKDYIDEKAIIKEAKKGFSEEVNKFFTKNFKEKPTPTSPVTPTATFSEMRFSGQISNYTTLNGPFFFTPGTYGTEGTIDLSTGMQPLLNSTSEYPIYNEALGVFALLETPKIIASKNSDNNVKDKVFLRLGYYPDDGDGYEAISDFYRYQEWTKEYQFKIGSPLKYRFNPVLDIKDYKIESSLVVLAEVKTTPSVNAAQKTLYQSFLNPNFNVNFESMEIDLNKFKPLIHDGIAYENVENELIIPTSALNNVFENDVNQIVTKDKFKVSTPYVDINAFSGVTTSLGIINQTFKNKEVTYSGEYLFIDSANWGFTYGGVNNQINFNGNITANQLVPNIETNLDNGIYYDFKFQLKLLIEVEYNTLRTDGTPNTSLISLTYDIPFKGFLDETDNVNWQSNDLVQDLINTNNNFVQFPENIVYENTIFDGSNVHDCKKNGQNYTCRAWNDIKILDNIIVQPGYKVDFIAGNEITVLPQTMLSPESSLSILPLLNYSNPMPESNFTVVKDFCKGANGNAPAYKANAPSKRILDLEVNSATNEENAIKDLNWDFSIYPNPTTSNTTVVLSGNNSTNYSVEVIDMTGKVIYSIVNNGEVSTSELELNGISKGVYFVKVNTLQGTKMKQLVIQ